jgi:predicted GH43/DUF377 family glycosyl hydrolase
LLFSFGGNRDSIYAKQHPLSSTMGSKLEIGVAVSMDGIHWSKIEGPGAYVASIEATSINQQNENVICCPGSYVGWPSVFEDDKLYRMYYHTFDPQQQKYIVRSAISKDSVNWQLLGDIVWKTSAGATAEDSASVFDRRGVTRRHVIKLSTLLPKGSQPQRLFSKDSYQYRMYYEGIDGNGKSSIGVAGSVDGREWIRLQSTPILSSTGSLDDNGGIGSPHALYLSDKKRWRLYYVNYQQSLSSSEDTSKVVLGIGDSEELAKSYGISMVESLDEEGLIFPN